MTILENSAVLVGMEYGRAAFLIGASCSWSADGELVVTYQDQSHTIYKRGEWRFWEHWVRAGIAPGRDGFAFVKREHATKDMLEE